MSFIYHSANTDRSINIRPLLSPLNISNSKYNNGTTSNTNSNVNSSNSSHSSNINSNNSHRSNDSNNNYINNSNNSYIINNSNNSYNSVITNYNNISNNHFNFNIQSSQSNNYNANNSKIKSTVSLTSSLNNSHLFNNNSPLPYSNILSPSNNLNRPHSTLISPSCIKTQAYRPNIDINKLNNEFNNNSNDAKYKEKLPSPPNLRSLSLNSTNNYIIKPNMFNDFISSTVDTNNLINNSLNRITSSNKINDNFQSLSISALLIQKPAIEKIVTEKSKFDNQTIIKPYESSNYDRSKSNYINSFEIITPTSFNSENVLTSIPLPFIPKINVNNHLPTLNLDTKRSDITTTPKIISIPEGKTSLSINVSKTPKTPKNFKNAATPKSNKILSPPTSPRFSSPTTPGSAAASLQARIAAKQQFRAEVYARNAIMRMMFLQKSNSV